MVKKKHYTNRCVAYLDDEKEKQLQIILNELGESRSEFGRKAYVHRIDSELAKLQVVAVDSINKKENDNYEIRYDMLL